MSTNKVIKEVDPTINIGKYGLDVNTGFTVKVLGLTKEIEFGGYFYELEVINPLLINHPEVVFTKPLTFCTVDSFKPFKNQKVYKLLYV